MPLKDVTPVIDDRNWQQLVDEIRSRIPHYTPEWTDLNDSDPGMTLAQVFAHLGEMLLYRMALVPELAYVKFLELIGIELTPAQPARAEIGFTVAASHPQPTVLIPAGTQVSAASEDGTPLVFETERALTALAARLTAVQVDDGAQYRDLTGADAAAGTPAAGRGFEPFGSVPRVDGALVLGFGFSDTYPTPDVFASTSIDIAFWTVPEPGTALVRQCGSDEAHASARIQWEGFDGARWVRAARSR